MFITLTLYYVLSGDQYMWKDPMPYKSAAECHAAEDIWIGELRRIAMAVATELTAVVCKGHK
jgi:hypothetical protein